MPTIKKAYYNWGEYTFPEAGGGWLEFVETKTFEFDRNWWYSTVWTYNFPTLVISKRTVDWWWANNLYEDISGSGSLHPAHYYKNAAHTDSRIYSAWEIVVVSAYNSAATIEVSVYKLNLPE